MRARSLILGSLAAGICTGAMIASTPSAALTPGGRVGEARQYGLFVLQIATRLKKGQCVKGRKYTMTKDGVFYRCYEQTCGMGPGLPNSDKPSCTAASTSTPSNPPAATAPPPGPIRTGPGGGTAGGETSGATGPK